MDELIRRAELYARRADRAAARTGAQRDRLAKSDGRSQAEFRRVVGSLRAMCDDSLEAPGSCTEHVDGCEAAVARVSLLWAACVALFRDARASGADADRVRARAAFLDVRDAVRDLQAHVLHRTADQAA